MRLAVILIVLAVFMPAVCLAETVAIGRFSAGDLAGWEKKSFKGETKYEIVTDGGGKVLHAVSNGTASGLFKKVDVDLNKTPILHWKWKIKEVLEKGDVRSKETDDYPARIYVVFPGSLFFNTTGLNYFWANKLPKGESAPNQYAKGKVYMVAVESGPNLAGKWTEGRVNVREDYRRLFGEEPPKVGAVAVMTDSDNTGGPAEAWYGDIEFLSE